MKLKKYLFIGAAILLSTSKMFGQHVHSAGQFCAANQDIYDRVAADPSYKKMIDSLNMVQANHLAAYKQNQTANRAGTIYYIPVVYHILHQNGSENISDEQVLDDLDQLNILFRKQNPSANQVNINFRNLATDVEIEFRLAQKKDDGTCFSGITRTFSVNTDNGGGGQAASNAINDVRNAHGNFPGDKYLNIFVMKDIGGAAGYTYQPQFGFTSMNNGIRILDTYVGRIGTSTRINENETMAHEVGHWLNLDHLWGGSNTPGVASNCNIDDGLGDTPNTIGNSNCSNLNVSTCGSQDLLENMMEYAFCANHMFTADQASAMRAAATSSVGNRNNVISAANHLATGIFSDILCEAKIGVSSTSACSNTNIDFFDKSFHNATSWSWSFPGGTPATSNAKNPVVQYSTPGIYSVTLTATNASGSKTVTENNLIRVIDGNGTPTPYDEGFETIASLSDEFIIEGDAINNWVLNSSSSFAGSSSASINNLNNLSGTTGELLSGVINLQGKGSASLSYRYSYAKRTGVVTESPRLFFSPDCGNTWNLMRGIFPSAPATNSFFTPTSSQWGQQTVNVSSVFLTSGFRYKFVLENGGGNNFYLDNININAVASINELSEVSNLSIYPNPFSNQATLELDLKVNSNVEIDVVDLVGKKLKSVLANGNLAEGNHKFTINKDGLTQGMYFVRLVANGKARLEKILVN